MNDTSPPEGDPVINITGELVALGPVRRALLPLYERWANDFLVARTLGAVFVPSTRESQEAWYERTAREAREVTFTVYERATMRPIGTTGLNEISRLHGTAEFWITIGERDAWGRGYGTETTRLMLDYAFTAFGLRNVMLKVHSFNERGIRAYARAGFKEIGRRRKVIPLAGRLHDDVYMDCLAEEFESLLLRRLLE